MLEYYKTKMSTAISSTEIQLTKNKSDSNTALLLFFLKDKNPLCSLRHLQVVVEMYYSACLIPRRTLKR